MILLRGFALAQACLDRFEIVLDVGVGGVAGLRLQQRLAGAARIAAQHIGVTAVIEDLRRGACDLGRLVVGAVGEIETPLAGVRRASISPTPPTTQRPTTRSEKHTPQIQPHLKIVLPPLLYKKK